MQLSIGFSPCPNDTFIFDALINHKIDTGKYTFTPILEDVATLNEGATQGRLDITKLSFNTFLHTVNRYALLRSGSALGLGVGPLLIAKPDKVHQPLHNATIAIPGLNTTANLLLSLAYPEAKQKVEMVFSDIEAAVANGQVDAGLIIHESRFTYQNHGLAKIADLGSWWEQYAHAAIPLGGIAIKRSLPQNVYEDVNELIAQSLAYAWKQYPSLSEYVTQHAQEMDEQVMRQHIDLYVNEYTTDLGPIGTHAINTLFTKAIVAGLLPQGPLPNIFY